MKSSKTVTDEIYIQSQVKRKLRKEVQNLGLQKSFFDAWKQGKFHYRDKLPISYYGESEKHISILNIGYFCG